MKNINLITLTIIGLLALTNDTFAQENKVNTIIKDVQLNVIQKNGLTKYDLQSQFKNKIVIIEFWETWCIPCIEAMYHLNELQQEFSNDLKIVCVSSDDLEKARTFIDNNKFSFDFIFDKDKIMQKKFPHSAIPHTIIIDKNGKIQAATYPGYLGHSHIKNLIQGKDINIPTVKSVDFSRTENEGLDMPLVSFKLYNFELGDPKKSSLAIITNKKRIVTGYTIDSFIDTVETITEYTASHKNILELYQFAFGEIPENRFLYNNDLKHIKSIAPNHSYNLSYKISNLFGNFNTTLVRQLNAALNFETFKTSIDTNVLVLKKMDINGQSIKIANTNAEKWMNNHISTENLFEINGNKVDVNTIVSLIAEKMKVLVTSDIKEDLNYELKIAMDKPNPTVDDWINYFQQEGLHLVKEKKSIEFIRIKSCP